MPAGRPSASAPTLTQRWSAATSSFLTQEVRDPSCRKLLEATRVLASTPLSFINSNRLACGIFDLTRDRRQTACHLQVTDKQWFGGFNDDWRTTSNISQLVTLSSSFEHQCEGLPGLHSDRPPWHLVQLSLTSLTP